MMNETKENLQKELERMQEVQASNPPSSKAWQEASTRIHELALSLEVFVMSLALIIDPLERKARKLQEQLDRIRCANLEQCRLGRVPTCKNASLADANLKGVNLKDANLKGVNLEGANS